jgi:hypothetical protein
VAVQGQANGRGDQAPYGQGAKKLRSTRVEAHVYQRSLKSLPRVGQSPEEGYRRRDGDGAHHRPGRPGSIDDRLKPAAWAQDARQRGGPGWEPRPAQATPKVDEPK